MPAEEQDEEIERDFKVMGKAYTEVAETVLTINHGSVRNHGTL